LRQLWDPLRDDRWPDEALREELLKVSAGFWMQRLDGDLEQRFAKVRLVWLCKGGYSPMGYMLSLLLYGKKIPSETGRKQ
jgi:hypothetical protein